MCGPVTPPAPDRESVHSSAATVRSSDHPLCRHVSPWTGTSSIGSLAWFSRGSDSGPGLHWTTICDDLALPASHAIRIDGLLRHVQRAGNWPTILASLEQLMTLAPAAPTTNRLPSPPHPREPGQRVHRSDRRRPTDPPQPNASQPAGPASVGTVHRRRHRLRTRLLGLGPGSPAYAAFRRQLAVRDADLFDAAHRRLQRSLQDRGPATWTPAAVSSPSGRT